MRSGHRWTYAPYNGSTYPRQVLPHFCFRGLPREDSVFLVASVLVPGVRDSSESLVPVRGFLTGFEKRGSREGQLSLIGGKVEADDPCVEYALLREFEEEVDFELTVPRGFIPAFCIFLQRRSNPNKLYRIHLFRSASFLASDFLHLFHGTDTSQFRDLSFRSLSEIHNFPGPRHVVLSTCIEVLLEWTLIVEDAFPHVEEEVTLAAPSPPELLFQDSRGVPRRFSQLTFTSNNGGDDDGYAADWESSADDNDLESGD